VLQKSLIVVPNNIIFTFIFIDVKLLLALLWLPTPSANRGFLFAFFFYLMADCLAFRSRISTVRWALREVLTIGGKL